MGGCELPGSLGVALGVTLKSLRGSLGPSLPICKWGFGAFLFSLGWEVMSSPYGKAAEERDRVKRIVIEEMEGAYLMQVPLQADCGWGKNWLEAH